MRNFRYSYEVLKRVQSPYYSTASLHSFIIVLFEKYAQLLEKQFSIRFDKVRGSSRFFRTIFDFLMLDYTTR